MTDGITGQPDGATSIEDTSGLLLHITTRGELDEAETLNILNAIEWMDSGRIQDVFTVKFYTDLHRQMFKDVWGWAGVLRTQTGNQVGEPFVRAEDVARELGRVAMEYGQQWEHDRGVDKIDDGQSALLVFLAHYHHALVVGHPFNNGNGRWSRLATDAVMQRLMIQGPLVWASSDAPLDEDGGERSAYFAALRSADSHDINPLIEYLRDLNPIFN